MPLVLPGQDYLPFKLGTKKALVAEDGLGRAYSLALDSFQVNGTDTTFFNYFDLDSVDTGGGICIGWGGPDCLRQDYPSWMGRSIERTSSGYSIVNLFNDTLKFNYTLALTDTIPFLVDDDQQFAIVIDQIDTMNILGVVDSVQKFSIVHQTLLGEPINSALNGSHIIIGKELGLIRFFQVDSFPSVLKPLRLLGDGNHELGLYEITPAVVHDYQIGDIVQFRIASGTYSNPSVLYFNKYTILSRIENDSMVIYEGEYSTYYPLLPIFNTGTSTRAYSKNEIIASIPFEKFIGDDVFMVSTNNCGIPIWRYGFEVLHMLGPCQWDPLCWVGVDTNGPPDTDSYGYQLGLGETYSHQTPGGWAPWGEPPTFSTQHITYYVK
ncbi:MAG: hypothetical protein M3R08_03125, partial [Bacteroidota bacterium]|nr:hypothetical protein [Bacteroidota bacterium]